tara:strand:- start:19964 stop:21139 length:1176 start_codon:yes stop_codon:yes gene_type:complete
MKKIIICLSLFAGWLTSAQSVETKKAVITDTISGHIYKPQQVDATDELINQLKMPSGFKISKFAENLGEARMMAASDDGAIYLTVRPDKVLMLQDTNNDGKADKQQTVITKEGAHGLAIKNDTLYLITVNDVFKGAINDDGTIGELEQIVKDLPDGGQHPNRTLAFGPDGMLYISVGSTCNACKETRDENATFVRVTPDGTNRTIYAKGLRNTIGYDWNENGELYAMDHGIDWLGDDEQKEELNLIAEGNDYGWPYIYADGKYNKGDEPPKMTWAEYAEKTTKPVMLFEAHSAPMNMKFYKGDMFPDEFKGSALITFHGSWNRAEPSGYNIMKLNFENGKPSGSEDFISGFVTDDGTKKFGRPVGLIELQDGSILFSDDMNGIIYRVSYNE